MLVSNCAPVLAQNLDDNTRPKLGLVLSGGGAKGLAHIGVLKVLEDAGIRPDYITGTSMGSVVGALYALGYSAKELDDLNNTVEWEQLLSDHTNLNLIRVDEKFDSNRYFADFPIIKRKVALPSGLIEGQQLEAFLSELTWPLSNYEDFDNFPIPFRCISTDLVSGEAMVHKHGDLVQAVRSSLAIPSIFSPVIMDSMLLVDGGVTDNFPVEEVRKMGADIVIGVYLGFDDQINPNDLFSITSVLSRSTALAGIVDARKQLKNVDLLIIPNLRGLSSSDFSKGIEIARYGEESALNQKDEILELISQYNLQSRPVRKVAIDQQILVSKIQVIGLLNINRDFVLGQSGLTEGKKYTKKSINESINLIMGTQHFSKVSYSLSRNDDDTYCLIISTKEKNRAYVKLSPFYSNTEGATMNLNLTLRDMFIHSSHLKTDISISEFPKFSLEASKFWGKNLRLANYYYIHSLKYKLPYYKENTKWGEYERRMLNTGVGLRYAIGLDMLVGTQVGYVRNIYEPRSLKTILPEVDFDKYSGHGLGSESYFTYSTINDLYFPDKGSQIIVRFAHHFNQAGTLKTENPNGFEDDLINLNQNNFSSLLVAFDSHQRIHNKAVLNLGVRSGSSSHDVGLIGYYNLGSYQQENIFRNSTLVGFDAGEILTNNFVSGHLSVNLAIFKNVYLGIGANIAYTSEESKGIFPDYSHNSFDSYFLGGAIGLSMSTPIGPIRVLLCDNNKDDSQQWIVSMGFPFRFM